MVFNNFGEKGGMKPRNKSIGEVAQMIHTLGFSDEEMGVTSM